MLTIGQAGKTVQQAGDTINDSLRGWKDADELHRLNEAESEDVYLKLPVPYRARSRALQDTAELLQISGVTREIYPGAKGQRGLVDLVTAAGRRTVNINNTAPRIALR